MTDGERGISVGERKGDGSLGRGKCLCLAAVGKPSLLHILAAFRGQFAELQMGQ